MVGDPDRLSEAEAIELLGSFLEKARAGHGDWQRPARAPAGISFPTNPAAWSSAKFGHWEVHLRRSGSAGPADVCLRQFDGRRWFAASGLQAADGALHDCVAELLELHQAGIGG